MQQLSQALSHTTSTVVELCAGTTVVGHYPCRYDRCRVEDFFATVVGSNSCRNSFPLNLQTNIFQYDLAESSQLTKTENRQKRINISKPDLTSASFLGTTPMVMGSFPFMLRHSGLSEIQEETS